jgi:hypothetical protein
MRHLGRIGVFTRTIKKFLVNLKRQHKELFTALGKELTDRYLGHKGASVFSMVKPSESAKTLEMVAGDLFALIEGLKNSEDVVSMPTYLLMLRVLKDQCIVDEDVETKARKVEVKKSKDVPSDSLQNPSDLMQPMMPIKGKATRPRSWKPFPTTKTRMS